MKKSLLLFLLFAGLFAFVPTTMRGQAVTGITLNKHTLALARWKSAQLTATISPTDAANKNVSWSSSNSDAVYVDNTGSVTGYHDGVATIYVKTEDGGFVDSCVVTCTVPDAANINAFSFAGEAHKVSILNDAGKVKGYLVYGTDPANLNVASYQISPGASITPLPETVHDFSDTVQFVVTSPDGTVHKTWKVSAMVLPDLRGTQKVKLTFSTAPQGWIADTVSWEESNIHFLIDYPNTADTTYHPSAAIDIDQDYSHEMGVSLFPAKLRFYLEDTSKVIIAASMYIFENCGDSCTSVDFFGIGGSQLQYIDKMTKSYHFFNLKNVKAEQGILGSNESSFSGITFWLANKDGSVNHQPVADAGPDQTVQAKDTVQLDGSASMDPDQDFLSYTWTAPQGITLNNPNTVSPTFVAPNSPDTLHLQFSLAVTDNKSTPVTDNVIITVIPTNHAPVANAGPNQTVSENDSVYLDATASHDADGDILTYHWLAPGGIVLTDTNSATPAFKAPDVQQSTIFSFGLIVNDGLVNSTLDTVFITVENINHRPIAWIDMDQITVNEGDSTYVEGHYSYDPDGDSLQFHWWAQNGSGIGFLDSTAMDVRIGVPKVDRDTTFEVYVKVSDGQLSSETDTAYIHIVNFNSAPVAVLQKHNSPVFDGDTVYLDGSSSYDADGDSLTFKWSGPNSVYLNKEGDSAWFVVPVVKKTTPFVFTLVVNDGQIDSPPDVDTIWVNHKNHAPVAVSGYPITLFEGDSSYLYGSLSYDFDADQLTYSWKVPAGFWIADSTQADPRFRAPEVTHDTTFSLILTVFDGQLYSAPDTCRVTVKNKNRAPVAKIVSTEQTFYGVSMNERDTLWIDGSPSYDPDGDPITYDWALPKAFDFYHYDSVKVMIIAPEVSKTTSYDAALFVSDASLRSDPDRFIIQVRNVNRAPVADAGKSRTTLSGQLTTLNGSGSHDPDGDSLRFTWIAPAGIALDDMHAIKPVFTAPEVTSRQVLTFKLVVSDGVLMSDTSTMEVTVKPIEATLRVAATVNDTTIPYRMRHITLYHQISAGSWKMENVLSYNANGDTYYAVWEGDWMATVDPVGDSTGFVTTFYGDVTAWESSNTFHVAGGAETQITIHCVPVAEEMTGSGSIDGAIVRDTLTAGTARNTISHVEGTRENTVPAAGVTIFLYRSSDDALLGSTLTDEQGKYSFKNMPSGEYYLIVQLPGYDTNTPWTVEVTDDNSQVGNVNFVVSEGDQSITDINNRQELQARTYPNPVTTYLNIRIENSDIGAEFRLYDITGHLIRTGILENRTSRLDMGAYRKGIYLLNIRSQNRVVTIKFIKH